METGIEKFARLQQELAKTKARMDAAIPKITGRRKRHRKGTDDIMATRSETQLLKKQAKLDGLLSRRKDIEARIDQVRHEMDDLRQAKNKKWTNELQNALMKNGASIDVSGIPVSEVIVWLEGKCTYLNNALTEEADIEPSKERDPEQTTPVEISEAQSETVSVDMEKNMTDDSNNELSGNHFS